ncbi:MAG: hypothetical protein R2874_08225 [Desulfobacterales bacterium]
MLGFFGGSLHMVLSITVQWLLQPDNGDKPAGLFFFCDRKKTSAGLHFVHKPEISYGAANSRAFKLHAADLPEIKIIGLAFESP